MSNTIITISNALTNSEYACRKLFEQCINEKFPNHYYHTYTGTSSNQKVSCVTSFEKCIDGCRGSRERGAVNSKIVHSL